MRRVFVVGVLALSVLISASAIVGVIGGASVRVGTDAAGTDAAGTDAVGTDAAGNDAAGTGSDLQIGVNYQPMWESMTDVRRQRILDELAAAGTEWVRVDVAWASLQPEGPDSYDMAWAVPRLDQRVREVRERDMKILLMLYWAPSWSSGTSAKNGRPADPGDYARAAAWVAERYDGRSVSPDLKVEAIELWNEPDLEYFWSQQPAATVVSDFAQLIAVAGPAVRRANPEVTVVLGGPSAIDVDWFAELYEFPGLIGSYDVVSVHPYQSPGDAPPDAFDPAWAKYYMANLPNLLALMDEVGEPAPVWLTEFGWSSHDNSGYGEAGPPNFARGVTTAEQADYMLAALAFFETLPRVEAAFWYNAANTRQTDPMQANFGLLTVDLERKPAWWAFKCANTGECDVVAPGAEWHFEASGAKPDAAWRDLEFDHSGWIQGRTEAGYGDGDEATRLPWGSVADQKPWVVYARHSFTVPKVQAAGPAVLRLKADDGAVVYLNGEEVTRLNLAEGALTNDTPAAVTVAGADEARWHEFDVPVELLAEGPNILAVQVHQSCRCSSDLSFDLGLTLTGAVGTAG